MPWEEAVVGEQCRKPREPLERRVRGQDQDPERRDLDDPEHEAERRSAWERSPRDLRDDRCAPRRKRVHLVGEPRHAHEERDRDHREDAERTGGVSGLRMPEGADAVRDRLDARESARARCKRPEECEQGDRSRSDRQLIRCDRGRAGANRAPRGAGEHEREHREDERVRRDRERDAGLPDTAQVDERDQDDSPDRQLHRQVIERGTAETIASTPAATETATVST